MLLICLFLADVVDGGVIGVGVGVVVARSVVGGGVVAAAVVVHASVV